ncbi:MAG: adenylate kinase [Sulfurospirillum sp.]|nr:adenylate kinase [Sulfurospirillum sp.]
MKSLFLIIGAPGSGKTTDAQIIAQSSSDVAHYSTGDLLRTAAKDNSKIGKKIAHIINAGEIVPVVIVLEAIMNVIQNAQEAIILIDGYPRSVEQMYGLDDTLSVQEKINLKGVIDVRVSDSIAKQRVLGRNRGDDDDMAIFENRLKVYYEPKEQIKTFYTTKNLYHVINGEREIKTVVQEMESLIHELL